MPSRRTSLAALAAPLLPACATTPTPDAIAAAVDRAFTPLRAEHAIPGLAVGVTLDGRRHLACQGVMGPGDERPVTPATLFELGSLSKPYTATLVAWAHASGRLPLDTPPDAVLPALRGSPLARATLLQLATYTAAGLPLQVPDAVTEATLPDWLRGWTPEAAPGRLRRYSNPSIGLAGLLVAQRLGQPFPDALRQAVLAPLGLRHTHVAVPATEQDRYAWGTGPAGQRLRVNPGVLDAQAYGLKASVDDLLRFAEAQLQPGTLPDPLRAVIALTHRGWYAVGPMVQCLGWEGFAAGAGREDLVAATSAAMALEAQPATPLAPTDPAARPALLHKTGSTNGFGAYAIVVPARRAGLVLLANRNIPNAVRVRAAWSVLRELAVV
jgi:beta-lactamase class C